jgi:MFS transporter, DHA2 family, multidrug resistance protein
MLQAHGMSAAQGHAVVNRLIDQQAFMLSANDLFYASGLLFVALVGVVWLARAPERAQANVSAASAAH